tara:strand:+ start:109 stop:828 length:720 start_codon:yes stop_codon:yes gene_type:complete
MNFLKNLLIRLVTYLSNSYYIKYTEIPEHIRLRDIFFKELEKRNAKEALDFVEKNCKEAMPFTHKHDLLKYAINISKIEGCILEFGVFKGKSINFIAKNTSQKIYGFDSFIGLPEDWSGGNLFVPKEAFDLQGNLPTCEKNVELIEGWFEDTVPKFKEKVSENIKLIHIDCDVYSSTIFVLEAFRSQLVKGSLIVFDEFYNFHGWKNHEYKALMEFKNKHKINFKYIGFTDRRMLIEIE